MFEGSKGRTMKWVTLLKDFKEKVGLTQSPSSAAASSAALSASSPSSSSRDNNVFSASQSSFSSPSRSGFEYLYFFNFIFRVYVL